MAKKAGGKSRASRCAGSPPCSQLVADTSAAPTTTPSVIESCCAMLAMAVAWPVRGAGISLKPSVVSDTMVMALNRPPSTSAPNSSACGHCASNSPYTA